MDTNKIASDMDLSVAGRVLYAAWCLASAGKAPDGALLCCWEALEDEVKRCWMAVALTAHDHVLAHQAQERDRAAKRSHKTKAQGAAQ